MAITTTTSNIQIRGITYDRYDSFVCASSVAGWSQSESGLGGRRASALTKGNTYYIYQKASGNYVTHPYLICSSANSFSIIGWYTEEIFPYGTYTVTYNSNGGTWAPPNQIGSYGETITLDQRWAVRPGFTFKGWGTASNSSSPNYYAGSSYKMNSDLNLYAIWEANVLTINYYSNYATESFAEALNPVDGNKNVLVRVVQCKYNVSEPDGLWNYTTPTSSTYLARNGYKGTGYWGTKPDGGLLVHQLTAMDSGRTLAEALGVSIDNGNNSVNIYPQWEPQNVAWYKINDEYKLCKTYIKVNDIWKPSIMYQKINGDYKRSIVK